MDVPGFTTESLAAVEEMLYGESRWKEQFLTGKTTDKLSREDKTTIAQGLQNMDIDSRPGRQRGNEGKQKEQSSDSISPVALPKGNPQQGPRSRSDLKGLAMFDELSATFEENCRQKPQPRSTEQRQATQQAQQAAQQQGQTFDQQPQQQVQDMGRQGGQAERKTTLPICPDGTGAKP